MFKKILLTVCAVFFLLNCSSVFAELFDDFGDSQSGSWAPARWWTEYASRGKCVVPGKKAVGPSISLKRGQRLKEITAAGGFVVEAELLKIRGDWAGISIGDGKLEKAAVAVVLKPDNSSSPDQVYVNGTSLDIGNVFKEGDKIRIEITGKNFSKGGDASVTVLIGGERVLSEYGFKWTDEPSDCLFITGSNSAVYDNLYIAPANPVIEFDGEISQGSDKEDQTQIKVILKHGVEGQEYAVDYKVTGGTAIGNGIDYTLNDGTVVFGKGENVKAINLAINKDNKDEYDESIEITLSNPKGKDVQLGGLNKHTFIMYDRMPTVSFENISSNTSEGVPQANITVLLSHPCTDDVKVNYSLVGGTAELNKDFMINSAAVMFAAGQTSRQISVDVRDDRDSENSIPETVILQLEAAENAAVGKNSRHCLNIKDNEPWIEFDGSMWICGFDKHHKINGKNVLSVNEKGNLEWVSTYGDILYATLEPQSLNKVGDVVEYGWLYKGDGQGKGTYVENICERYGSGDLRVSFLDLGDKSMSLSKQYTRNDGIFCGSKGYQARLSPHVPIDERSDKWAIRVNPSGGNCHSPVDWGGCWGFEQYFNGHGVPVGEFTPMIIDLVRVKSDTVHFSVTMNNEKHTLIDKDKAKIASDQEKMRAEYGMGAYGTGAYGTGYAYGKHEVDIVPGYQPDKIDLMAMYFANQRPLELITFAPLDKKTRESIAKSGLVKESFPLED